MFYVVIVVYKCGCVLFLLVRWRECSRIDLFDFVLLRDSDNEANGFSQTAFNLFCMTFLVKSGSVELFEHGVPLTNYDVAAIYSQITPNNSPISRNGQPQL